MKVRWFNGRARQMVTMMKIFLREKRARNINKIKIVVGSRDERGGKEWSGDRTDGLQR